VEKALCFAVFLKWWALPPKPPEAQVQGWYLTKRPGRYGWFPFCWFSAAFTLLMGYVSDCFIFNNFYLYQYVIVLFYELSYNKRDKKASGFKSAGLVVPPFWLVRLFT